MDSLDLQRDCNRNRECKNVKTDNKVNDQTVICYKRKLRNREDKSSSVPSKIAHMDLKDMNNFKSSECCKFCHQLQPENVSIPFNAEPECIVLAHDILANIYTDESDIIHHNLTNYSIHDRNGHMCAIDSGIMESNTALYLTGYVKPIYNNDPSIKDGIAAVNLGPILEWWLSTYDGGSQAVIFMSTDYADYLLIEPHPCYKKYMTSVIEKIHLSKLVIENIIDNQECDDPIYEDILSHVVSSVNPATGNTFTEEDLIAHAQFVIDQVVDYDSTGMYLLPLADTKCIETLAQLSGAEKKTYVSQRNLNRARHRTTDVETNITPRVYNRATTTELVKDVFESMFAAQLNIDDTENETTVTKLVKNVFNDVCLTENQININISINNNNEVLWNNQKLCKKMFVIVKNDYANEIFKAPTIGRIEYLFKTNSKTMAHIIFFLHGYQTVLGETADCQEIFSTKYCASVDVNDIIKIAEVNQKIPSDNWFNLGNSKLKTLSEPVNRNKKNNSFFFQLQFDEELGWFEYPKLKDPCDNKKENYCSICEIKKLEKESKVPSELDLIQERNGILYYHNFKLNNINYKVGNFIYLKPGTFLTASRLNLDKDVFQNYEPKKREIVKKKLIKKDETLFPEHYRKTQENTMRGSNETTPEPFDIGEIVAVYNFNKEHFSEIKISVRRMYRPEQIPSTYYDKNVDMNLLYWSEERFCIHYSDIFGKCYVTCSNNILDPLEWAAGGPDRFHFNQQYNSSFDLLDSNGQLSSNAKLTGKELYNKLDYNYILDEKVQFIPPYMKIEPLRGLDIFAGCGGLSKGLEDSGLVKIKWAVECDDKAATAFKLNNPGATVFVEDCNNLLNLAMLGNRTNNENQVIPKKGEVDFICGGPPCQGFSGMNRFNSGQYSLFKNSMIVSFLSFIDYYRPRYFVMENVRNFVSFKNSMVFKLTLRCITRMGYQCTFGIIQAGNFGVPQTRRRLIIMGAAPGEQVPLYPEPTHVFNKRGSNLNVQVDEKTFKTNCKYEESAPLRTVTVYDAWSDLPKIPNGADIEKIPYQSPPITHLQKLLRHPDNLASNAILIDHICKCMSPLVLARIERIPVEEGSDWRDLSNLETKLSDGTVATPLIYTHRYKKSDNSLDCKFRGVCQCASGEKCNPLDRQNNTIIPWCLPHTGNRHNNWAGLYGRLAWTGFCSTTITNPEPMGKQGRVLHPEQHRVVSVRECARSQGFNDSFIFYGPILNKHRQIGNAVPPPMGKAIGHEIIKALNKSI